MALSHGLLVGNRHATIRTPQPPSLASRLWAAIQPLTSRLLCQLALFQIRSRASLPLASSRSQQYPRNCVVMELTGRPSTNLSHVFSSSGTYRARSRRGPSAGDRPFSALSRSGESVGPHRFQECNEGRSKRENQVSSSNPRTHSGRLSANRISRSRAPFFEHTPDRGSRSNAWLAPNAPPAERVLLGWSRH